MLDQLVDEVDALDLVVFGRAGETGLHAGRESVDKERAGGQGVGGGKLGHRAEKYCIN